MEQVTIYPEWQQTVKDISTQFTHGDMITFQWLYDSLRMKKPTYGSEREFQEFQFKFLSNIEEIKAELLEQHKMYLHNVRGQGYLIVQPDEQTEIAWQRMKKSISKAFRSTGAALTNIKHDLLTSEQKAQNTNKLATLAQLRIMARKAIKSEPAQIAQ